jgi:hypothetical protein
MEIDKQSSPASLKKHYKNRRDIFIGTVIGIVIVEQILTVIFNPPQTAYIIGNGIFAFINLFLMMTIYYNWALYKGRSRYFMFLSLIGFLGFIPMALLKDKNPNG